MTEDNIAEIIKALKPMLPAQIESNKDMIGLKFGKLTILGTPGKSQKRKCIMAKCLCDCGNFTIAALSDVKRMHTSSCGCLVSSGSTTHGDAGSVNKKAKPEYVAWSRMKCQVNKAKKGGEVQGVGYVVDGFFLLELVCNRWTEKDKGYINFLEDMGRKPPRSQLRKHDKSKRYDKENCYWWVAK